MFKRLKITTALLAAACLGGPVTTAQAEQPRTITIPAGELNTALETLVRQTGIQLLYDLKQVEGLRTRGVNGAQTPQAAVSALLKGTSLTTKTDESGAILISTANTSVKTSAEVAQDIDLRLARSEDPQSMQKVEESTAPGSQKSADKAPEDAIIVTGTHIRGSGEVAATKQTYDREDFARGGYSSVEQFFKSLPQNFSEVTPEGYQTAGHSRLAQSNSGDLATSVDLRGLGADSTLTLVNGSRRAGSGSGRFVDVSAIPLSVLERVEVVTGGGSAIYGTDAVAGVVNLVTRREFTGAETQATYGSAEGGGQRFRVSHITGFSTSRGGAVLSYDYGREGLFDLAGTDLVISPGVNDETILAYPLLPDTQRHSVFASGRFSPGKRIELYADALYTQRKYVSFSSVRYADAVSDDSFDSAGRTSEHADVTAGLKLGLGAGWKLDLSGSYSDLDIVDRTVTFSDGFDSIDSFLNLYRGDTRVSSVSGVVDGKLFSAGRFSPQGAFGAEYSDSLQQSTSNVAESVDQRRHQTSVFGEVMLPIVAAGERSGLNFLQLTLAGRYDEYSDFGRTFNPQFGVVWGPADNLKVRTSYSTAFRAPALLERRFGGSGLIFNRSDPQHGGASVPVLQISGQDPSMGPEDARTWTLGIDYEPRFARGMTVSLSYFNIDYKDRIDVPAIGADALLVLQREAQLGTLINRHPDLALLQSLVSEMTTGRFSNLTNRPWDRNVATLLTAIPDLIVFDNRAGNIAVETVRGLDLGLKASHRMSSGTLDLQLNGTLTLDHERRITANSPAFSRLNEVGKPVDFRLRAAGGWSSGPFSTFLNINYVDSYVNPFTDPSSGMPSWTTADLVFRLDTSTLVQNGILDNLTVMLSAENVLDESPPRIETSVSSLAYDGANASALGRYVTLHVTKRWGGR